jgi:hypothetical protein
VNREALFRLIDDGPPFGLPVVAGRLIGSQQGAVVADASSAKALLVEDSEPISSGPPAFAAPGSDDQRGKS